MEGFFYKEISWGCFLRLISRNSDKKNIICIYNCKLLSKGTPFTRFTKVRSYNSFVFKSCVKSFLNNNINKIRTNSVNIRFICPKYIAVAINRSGVRGRTLESHFRSWGLFVTIGLIHLLSWPNYPGNDNLTFNGAN